MNGTILKSPSHDIARKHFLGKSGAILLSNGDELQIGRQARHTFTYQANGLNGEETQSLNEVQHAESKVLSIIPNIIKLKKVYHSDNTLFMFEEISTAGDLFTYLECHNGRLEDTHGAIMIRQILMGVQYLHKRNIVHRDLRLENILVTKLSPTARLIITDFGQATTSQPQHKELEVRLQSQLGALEYVAPEVYGHNTKCKAAQGYLGKPADMYSVGSIVYKLLRGDKPFKDEKDERWNQAPGQVIIERAGRLDHEQANKPHQWTDTTERAKSFLAKLFKRDPNERISARQALQHMWVANEHVLQHFDKLYMRAKADWKPEADAVNSIERLPALAKEARFSKSKETGIAPVTFCRDSSVSRTDSGSSDPKTDNSTSHNHANRAITDSPAVVSDPKDKIFHATCRGNNMPPPLPAVGQTNTHLMRDLVGTSSPDPLGLSSSVSGVRKRFGPAAAQSLPEQSRPVKRGLHQSPPDMSAPRNTLGPQHSSRWSSSLSPIPDKLSPLPSLQQESLSIATTASASFPPWTQNAPSQGRKRAQVRGVSKTQAYNGDQSMLDTTSTFTQATPTGSRKRRYAADSPATGGVEKRRIQPPRAAATQKNKQDGTGKLKRVNRGKKQMIMS
ncbi:MAG: hypothetical protein M1831_002888 [Alyxoria varia]|nr:MAG: hypothetical protein M1831_002888 [Alyxoria varia]